jgi:hypothetical protein
MNFRESADFIQNDLRLKTFPGDLFDTQDALIYKLLRIKRKTLQPTDE